MTKFSVNKKATIRVEFSFIPQRFEIFDAKGRLFFFRDLSEKNKVIKVNVARPGTYTTNVVCKITVLPLEIIDIPDGLPPLQKNFLPDQIKYRYNPELKGTPARNFYKHGVIEFGREFLNQPYPIRVFILCHEIGHFYYHDEDLADHFAVKLYLKMGYNKSMALHALKDVLNMESQQNHKRVKKIFETLSK